MTRARDRDGLGVSRLSSKRCEVGVCVPVQHHYYLVSPSYIHLHIDSVDGDRICGR